MAVKVTSYFYALLGVRMAYTLNMPIRVTTDKTFIVTRFLTKTAAKRKLGASLPKMSSNGSCDCRMHKLTC